MHEVRNPLCCFVIYYPPILQIHYLFLTGNIFYNYCTGTVAILRLPQFQGTSLEIYGLIYYMNHIRSDYKTTTNQNTRNLMSFSRDILNIVLEKKQLLLMSEHSTSCRNHTRERSLCDKTNLDDKKRQYAIHTVTTLYFIPIGFSRGCQSCIHYIRYREACGFHNYQRWITPA